MNEDDGGDRHAFIFAHDAGCGHTRSGGTRAREPRDAGVESRTRPGSARRSKARLRQRGCAIELIVVDDGSDTPVAELLADVADERLRLLRVPHGRVSRARGTRRSRSRGATSSGSSTATT